MISVHSNGARTPGGDTLAQRELSLLEKKKLQWAREREEASNEWFPFGRPGSGAPLRSSVRRSSSSNRDRSSSQSGQNDYGQPSDSSPANAPSGPVMHMHYPGQGYHQLQTPSIPPYQSQNGTSPPIVGTYGTQYLPQNVAYPQSQLPYYHSVVVNSDGQPVPYAVVHSQSGPMYQPVPTLQGHKNLAAIPVSPENVPAVPYQPGSNSNVGISPQDMQPQTSALTYTEQWANQLPYWESATPSDIATPSSCAVGLPQLKPQSASTQSQYGGSVSTIVPDLVTPAKSLGNLTQPQTAWVAPQPQRTAVVQPQPSIAPPTSLALDQSLDSSLGKLSLHSPLGVSNGFIDGASTSFGASQYVYTPVQPSFDAMSTGTGHSASRRYRRITGPTEEEEWEKADKNLEQKMVLDEQVAEKQRDKMLKAERERMELERAEAEMRRIELRETMENEAERSKWKDLWETEQKREQLVLKSLEKAKEEARLLKEAKLMHHAKNAHPTATGRRPPMEDFPLEDENLSQVSRSIDALERAREEAEQMVKRDKLKKELERKERERLQEEKRTQEQQENVFPDSILNSRSKSVPPSQGYFTVTHSSSPSEDRPIRPARQDPLEIWEKMGCPDNHMEQENETPRRRTPVRQSMRTKPRSSEVAAIRKNRRADSLERLAKKAEEEPPPERPPRTRRKEKKENTADISIETPAEAKQSEKKSKQRSGSPSTKKPPATLPIPSVKPSKTSSKSSSKSQAPESGEKGRKLLTHRPSIEQMLYPPGEKVASSSDSDASVKQKNTGREENPWGDSLGGLNPLLQPLSTRVRGRRRSDQRSSKSPERSKAREEEPMDDVPMSSSFHPLLKERRTDSVDWKNRKPTFSATGQIPPSVRVEKKEKEEEEWRPFVRGGIRASASMENFNTKSPLYSSISSKRGQPTERQQKILEQLASLRKQLKSKQKQVEDSFVSESKSPRFGHSRTNLFENSPSSDC